MLDFNCKIENCSICKNEYTTTYIEAKPGLRIYVCDNCTEAAKSNFIWICLSCGKVYIKPKRMVMDRAVDFELKQACAILEDVPLIQGIDICISCDPEGILNYMTAQKMGAEC